MRAVLEAHGDPGRTVWVADSFQGLPVPDADRFPAEAVAHASDTMTRTYKHFAVSRADVEANFKTFGLLDEQVRFLEGWFEDTLPTAPHRAPGPHPPRRRLLPVDHGRAHQPVRQAVPGGYVVVDDYGEDLWTYCRKAVDDFRRERGLTGELTRVDSKCFYWRRAR